MLERAVEQYEALGVNVEEALATLAETPLSLHCWQGDDVGGFENSGDSLGGGLAVTGNYPGKAHTIEELQQDIEQVLGLIPGSHRLNLHAIYGDFRSKKADRDEITLDHFQGWVDWAKQQDIGMDFNPSCFSHSRAADGFTLSSPDAATRNFWIEHCRRSRAIGAEMGRQLGSPCVTNVWVPDGMKDLPVHRQGYRERLSESLDKVFSESLDPSHHIDAVECKLFGIGSESMVVGSHEFYLAYAITRQTGLCLDAGHFHPTESIADKISSVLPHIPHLLLHVSRGVRWDSDHVVLFDDPTREIMQELVRCNALPKTSIGLDFFDASINRIAAWALGSRAAQKSLLFALLEPRKLLREAELSGDFTTRLALLEQLKSLPWGVVWQEFCQRHGAPGDDQLLSSIKAYEEAILSNR